jgi:hypothetical protein
MTIRKHISLKATLADRHHERMNWKTAGAANLWFHHPHQFWEHIV